MHAGGRRGPTAATCPHRNLRRARHGRGEWGLLVQQQGGRWSSATDLSAVGHLHMSTALDWQRRVSKAVMEGALADGQAAACTRHAVTSCKAAGLRELLAVLGSAFTYMEENQLVPEGVTVCDAADLDRNPERRYLGARNGVIDLDSARLLPPAQARQKFVTRHLPTTTYQTRRTPMRINYLRTWTTRTATTCWALWGSRSGAT